jgi:hypothetical protein
MADILNPVDFLHMAATRCQTLLAENAKLQCCIEEIKRVDEEEIIKWV